MSDVKILVEDSFLVEVDDHDLVVCVAGADHVQSSLFYFGAFLSHGSRIIDKNSQRNRNVLPAK